MTTPDVITVIVEQFRTVEDTQNMCLRAAMLIRTGIEEGTIDKSLLPMAEWFDSQAKLLVPFVRGLVNIPVVKPEDVATMENTGLN